MEIQVNNSKKSRIFILIAIFTILICYLSYSLWKGNEEIDLLTTEIEVQKIKILEEIDLRSDLDNLIDQHQNLLDDYDIQDEDLIKQDSIIGQLKNEIEDLLNTKKDLKKAREKIVSLQEISKRYFKQIDSLLILSEGLVVKNDSLIRENKSIINKNQDLNKKITDQNSIIDKGSKLKVFNIDIQKIKFGTMRKEMKTKKAKKVQIIRCCFFVSANSIAKSENKKIHIQYFSPDGRLLKSSTSPKGSEFFINDSLVQSTTFIDFDYKNSEIELCIDWQRGDMLTEGDYKALFIIDGQKVGSSYFILN